MQINLFRCSIKTVSFFERQKCSYRYDGKSDRNRKRLHCLKSKLKHSITNKVQQKKRKLHACTPPPPGNFWNEFALRCNLLHFETHWPRRAWMIFPLQLLIYCNDNILGGGGELGILRGGNFYPSTTLDRTLTSFSSKSILYWTTETIVNTCVHLLQCWFTYYQEP